MKKLSIVAATLVFVFVGIMRSEAHAEERKWKCLFVNSYHKGYDWSDGVEQALYQSLQGQCELSSFYLDAKRAPAPESQKQKALEAKALIESTKPDIVIVSDDNAVKELLTAHYKDAKLPFVFCGVNWTTKTYGLPYRNATGMIEISPVRPLVQEAKKILPKARTATYLVGDVKADRENYEIFRQIYKEQGIELKPFFVKSMAEWEKGYLESQKEDFFIVANNAGIDGWDPAKAQEVIRKHSKKLTVTNHDYMTKFVVLSLTKIPAEQGEWAAKVALEILGGTAPSQIPVATNRRWNIYVNEELARLTKSKIPSDLSRKAIKTGL